jgi:hypothetical protein
MCPDVFAFDFRGMHGPDVVAFIDTSLMRQASEEAASVRGKLLLPGSVAQSRPGHTRLRNRPLVLGYALSREAGQCPGPTERLSQLPPPRLESRSAHGRGRLTGRSRPLRGGSLPMGITGWRHVPRLVDLMYTFP